MKQLKVFIIAISVFFISSTVSAEDTLLLRYPDIHNGQVVFVYGGDIYTVSENGGIARKLTSSIGKEILPKFSPDGKTLAFSAQYDGNFDVYTMPAEGGEPVRHSYYPSFDQVCDWMPDGKNILFVASRMTAINRIRKFFKVSLEGGLPEALELYEGSLGSFSPDGTKIAYNRISREFRTWKRYKGGQATDIWIYDFKNKKTSQLTTYNGGDRFPMWVGNKIYFISDRDKIMNLYSIDLATKKIRQHTQHKEFDIKWPSLGTGKIIYENGGYIYVFDIKTEKTHKLSIQVKADHPSVRPEFISVKNMIRDFELSPSGNRAIFSARGEVFTVPAKKGTTSKLTRTSGIRERNGVWSPDAKTIAYISDQTGEEEIFIKNNYGKDNATQLTKNSIGYMFSLIWSPDSSKIAYANKKLELYYVDVKTGKKSLVLKAKHGEIFYYSWSPDSKWIAYAEPQENGFNKIRLYSITKKKHFDVTTEMSDSYNPVFGRQGKYLFFLSQRDYNPMMGNYEMSYVYNRMARIYLVTLRDAERSPFEPKSDEEAPVVNTKEEVEAQKKADAIQKKKAKIKAIDIDIEGIQDRVIPVPIPPGNYSGLSVGWDKLLYLSGPTARLTGGPVGGGTVLHVYDLEKRKDHDVLVPCDGYVLSARGEKMIYKSGGTYGIADVGVGRIDPAAGALNLDGLTMKLNRRDEWKQIFREAWRKERDLFYAKNMHGVDWDKVYKRYEKLMPHIVNRGDLNYVIGEMISELNCSHAYVWGGDMPTAKSVNVGLLGVDFELDNKTGRYLFKKIFSGQNWSLNCRSPLTAPGIKVEEGEYLLAVNGTEIKYPANPYSFFENLAGKVVTLKINSKPVEKGSRDIAIQTIGDESQLRYMAWVEKNRQAVSDATNGKVGYVHIPSMGGSGLNEFSRAFFAQIHKKALIIDVRYNGGGFVSQMILEKLKRKLVGMSTRRDGSQSTVPRKILNGPLVCIANRYSASDGDIFPYFFKKYKLGKLIGQRTWGGTVGICYYYGFIDGGMETAPEFGYWDPDKKNWVIEGHGVAPDIEIDNLPEDMLKGRDTQLEKAIEVILQELRENPKEIPPRPALPDKS